LKVVFVDGVHHQDHAARGTFERTVFGELFPVAEAFGDVPVGAVEAQ
jgi:hypothetical protein